MQNHLKPLGSIVRDPFAQRLLQLITDMPLPASAYLPAMKKDFPDTSLELINKRLQKLAELGLVTEIDISHKKRPAFYDPITGKHLGYPNVLYVRPPEVR